VIFDFFSSQKFEKQRKIRFRSREGGRSPLKKHRISRNQYKDEKSSSSSTDNGVGCARTCINPTMILHPEVLVTPLPPGSYRARALPYDSCLRIAQQ
jgi:hypothetical protein